MGLRRGRAAAGAGPERGRACASGSAALGPLERLAAYTLGLVGGTALAALLLGRRRQHAPCTRFWHATFDYQLGRQSPFSLWDWGVLYRGFPDLRLLQSVLKALLVAFALLLFVFPRRLDAVRLAALTGALLVGFELTLSHWFYLYIPWFFPFAIVAFCAPSRQA